MSLPNGVLKLQPKGGHGYHNGYCFQNIFLKDSVPKHCVFMIDKPNTFSRRTSYSVAELSQILVMLRLGIIIFYIMLCMVYQVSYRFMWKFTDWIVKLIDEIHWLCKSPFIIWQGMEEESLGISRELEFKYEFMFRTKLWIWLLWSRSWGCCTSHII